MAKGKKKNERTRADNMAYWFNIFGAFLTLVTIVPVMPWRYVPINTSFGSRFSMYRMFSLVSAGDKYGQMASWMKFRREMCRAMQLYMTPNPLNAVLGVVAMGANKATGIPVGGAAVGCAAWQACKDHVSARCGAYTTLLVLGLACAVFNLVSAVCGFSVPFLIGMEAGIKKKKKLEAAKFNTMAASIAACILAFLGWVAYTFVSSSTFKGLQNTGYYPYPGAHAGLYIAVIANLLQFVGTFFAIHRLYPLCGKGGDKKDDDEDEDRPQATDLPPGAGPAEMPHGMDPGGYGMYPMGPGMPPGAMGMPPPPPPM